MLTASLSSSSLNTNRRPWVLFKEFEQIRFHLDDIRFPVHPDILALFTAKLYSPTTVFTYTSVIGFIHRVAEVPNPTKSERVQHILTGADIRLPVTLLLLKRIMLASVHTQPTQFQRKLAKAMCSLAFCTALRIGVITSRPGQSSDKIIQLQQISFLRDCDGEFTGLKWTLTNYKHSDPLRPVELLVCREQPVCPMSQMLE